MSVSDPIIAQVRRNCTLSDARNWEAISQAVRVDRRRARRYAETLSRIYKTGKSKNDLKWAEAEVKNVFSFLWA